VAHLGQVGQQQRLLLQYQSDSNRMRVHLDRQDKFD
jgi:hypothetical protein